MPAASPRLGAAIGIVIGVGLAVATSAAGVPEKVRALISIFGRETPVELEFYQIEKV